MFGSLSATQSQEATYDGGKILYVRDVLMWGAFICGVGAIPALLALNAVNERAAMAPPPTARPLYGDPVLALPEAPHSWGEPALAAARDGRNLREPARTGTLPQQNFASGLSESSVPLPHSGERSDSAEQNASILRQSPAGPAHGPDEPSPDLDARVPDRVILSSNPSSLPSVRDMVQSLTPAARPMPPSGEAAAAPSGQSGLDAETPKPLTENGPKPDAGPAPVLPPVRPPTASPDLPSQRVELTSEATPPKPPKRRTSSNKRRQSPPAPRPTIPVEQQFEWIQR
jgi:hypothetical protein